MHLEEHKMSAIGEQILQQFQVQKNTVGLLGLVKVTMTQETNREKVAK